MRVFAFAVAATICTAPLASEELHVPGQYPTIQLAIDAASDGDAIILAEGTFSGSGNYDLQWNAFTKHLTIESDSGPESCIIDCGGQGRGFILNRGQTRADVIRGITVRNGRTLAGSILGAQECTGGGAVLIIGTSPQILGCILEDNATLFDPQGGGFPDGGAVDAIGVATPVIAQCAIRRNHARHTGGGIHVGDGATPVIVANAIANNVNDGCYGGGGIAFVGNSGGVVANNVIVDNEARYYSAGGYGGGIICMNSDPYIVNNTIAGNSTWHQGDPGEGGGVRIRGLPSSVMVNNIIWGNLSEPGLEDLDFQYPDWVLDIHHCDVGIGLDGIDTGGAIGNISDNPLFADPTAGDYSLLVQSPSVDAGDTASLPEDLTDLDGDGDLAEPLPLDFVGGSRVVNAVDMGACEVQAVIFDDGFESGNSSAWSITIP